ncbi:SGNH hydrolase domain-containing protein [Cellulomonas alba]|uniref:SGNH hydrolase domain-containing protein n=1 Tax=Cellulomonas alba TaxID=3053467 RepID=A0ABT7SJL6_9CELL|nr:SGNH hydrolase domain-containing protein [Cellulomonas alba]MDM7856351.1 SGNH hydrolase domain-containing protein [Cellulomonas alba]
MRLAHVLVAGAAALTLTVTGCALSPSKPGAPSRAAVTPVAVATTASPTTTAATATAPSVTRAQCLGAGSMVRARQATCARLIRTLVLSPAAAARDWTTAPCFLKRGDSRLVACRSVQEPRAGVPRVLLLGDSHARMYLRAFDRLAAEGKLTYDAYLKGGCQWSYALPKEHTRAAEASCATWAHRVTAYVRKHAGRYDAVVTSAFAAEVMKTPRGESRLTYMTNGLVSAWKPVLRTGIPVIVIRDAPHPVTERNTCLARHHGSTASWTSCGTPRAKAFRYTDPQIAAVKHSQGHIRLLSFTRYVCTTTWCPAAIGGIPVSRDNHHLTATYAQTLAPQLWAGLAPALGR